MANGNSNGDGTMNSNGVKLIGQGLLFAVLFAAVGHLYLIRLESMPPTWVRAHLTTIANKLDTIDKKIDDKWTKMDERMDNHERHHQ